MLVWHTLAKQVGFGCVCVLANVLVDDDIDTVPDSANIGQHVSHRVSELYSLVRFLQIDPFAYYFCRRVCWCWERVMAGIDLSMLLQNP